MLPLVDHTVPIEKKRQEAPWLLHLPQYSWGQPEGNLTLDLEHRRSQLLQHGCSRPNILQAKLSSKTEYPTGVPVFLCEEIKTGFTVAGPRAPVQKGMKKCIEKFANITIKTGRAFCKTVYDGYLCWSGTPAGEVSYQNCPPIRLSDTTKHASRQCGSDGNWVGKHPNETSPIGYTNYTTCFTPLVQSLLNKVYNDSDIVAQRKFTIAETTRFIEIVGFSLSLIALTISLVIFGHYRSLRNHRTRIHKCLFTTMIIQVIIRLTVYIDQAVSRQSNLTEYEDIQGIDSMTYLCETSYVLLEYFNTSMFLWMFVEGLYLYNMVTASVFKTRISYVAYCIIGWGLPVIVTAVWATLTALHYKGEKVNRCWYGYNFSPLYWILEGPRMTVVLINLVFLLNILAVLIVKLRQSTSTEIQKIKKAVRAALVLLPLLGITNALNMIEPPLDGSVWKFAIWSFASHSLRSLQGFFIALIYCFMNAEVRQCIRKHYENYKLIRQYRQGRGQRDAQCASGIEMQTIKQRKSKKAREPKLRMKWTRPTPNAPNVSDTECGAESSQEHKMTTVKSTEASTVSAIIHAESEGTQTKSKEAREPKLRIKWTRPTPIAPNVSDTECGADNSQDEANLGPSRYRPYHGTPRRHHGVIVRNIKIPYASKSQPSSPRSDLYD